MRRIATAAAIAGLTLVAGATAPALGATHHPNAGTVFKSSVSPSRNVTPGTTMTMKSSSAKPKTSYYCVFIVLKGSDYAADTGSATLVKSNKKGHVSCTKTFQPYTATDQNNKTRHCPTTKADAKAGFSCAMSLADQATQGQTSASVAKFSAKK
jgi:hypothetical protein